MRNISDSDCDCLPDCELMDLQYSVSANKFMWVWLCNFVHFSTFFYGDQRVKKFSKFRINFFRPCDSRNLNLSPLCTFETGTLPKYWLQEVKMPRKNQRKSFHCRWSRPTPIPRTPVLPTSHRWTARWGRSTRTVWSSPSQRWEWKAN